MSIKPLGNTRVCARQEARDRNQGSHTAGIGYLMINLVDTALGHPLATRRWHPADRLVSRPANQTSTAPPTRRERLLCLATSTAPARPGVKRLRCEEAGSKWGARRNSIGVDAGADDRCDFR